MTRTTLLMSLAVLVVLAAGAGLAAPPEPEAQGADQPVLSLSPKLRGALAAEMIALRESMAELTRSLTTGEWDKVAAQARRIRESYIMEQQLSPAELEELHRVLPGEFVFLDERLHHHAEALAEAAEHADAELALFYFQKITEGCVACHARFATHTLKGFEPAAPARAH